MDIRTIDVDDTVTVDEILATHRAAHRVDAPDTRGLCPLRIIEFLNRPADYARNVHRVARVDGKVVGHLAVEMPQRDNLHFAEFHVTVHPDYRRRGIGTALVNTAMELARENGRRVLVAGTRVTGDWDGAIERDDAGDRLARTLGFRLVLNSIDRRLDLAEYDSDTESRQLEAALAASPEYETVAWADEMPEELLEPIARINGTIIAEVPLGDLDLEDEVIDVARVRDQTARAKAAGLFRCGVVARPKGSTEVVANSLLAVPTEPGTFAEQWITIVAPEHRGHKLGLRTKIENLRQLREHRPSVRYIETDNAAENDHMVAINDAMGFKKVDLLREYQIEL